MMKEENKESKNSKDEQKNKKQENENGNIQNKKGFFKKAWYSITKIEKYPEMATEGVPRAIGYLVKLALIISIVIGLGTIYQMNQSVKAGIDYIQNNLGDFSYKDGILDMKSEAPITSEHSTLGKVIIDTKIDKEEDINKHINTLKDENGVILLKDKALLKTASSNGIISYNYKDIFGQMNITEFTKQDLINSVNSNNVWNFYLSLFLMVIIYTIVIYILSILWNAVIISIVGYFATWFAKIKMRYAAIFNMSIYALTLSVLLNTIYIGINVFVDFDIKYFQVMYIAVAAIYLIAAIFIIKSEFIKKQIEVAKIVEIQEKIKQEQAKKKEEEEKDKKQDKPEEKKKERKNKPEEKQKDGRKGEEPEGSEA